MNKRKLFLIFFAVFAMVVACVSIFLTRCEYYPWAWAAQLSTDDIDHVEIWIGIADEKPEHVLTETEIETLVNLLNKLNRFDFKHNSTLVGSTPEYGIRITCDNIQYGVSDAGNSLEMRYNGKMWWIKDRKLFDHVKSLLQNVTVQP